MTPTNTAPATQEPKTASDKSQRSYRLSDLGPLDAVAQPIWVFDPRTNAMRWANAAGVRLWEASSVEDLASRTFQAGELGGDWLTVRPRAGVAKTVRGRCSAMRLDDEPTVLVEAYPTTENAAQDFADDERAPTPSSTGLSSWSSSSAGTSAEDAAEDAADSADDAQLTSAVAKFHAVMAHELRTPLNAVLGFSELLAETRLDGAQQSYVETIRSSSLLLRAVVDDLLDIAATTLKHGHRGAAALEIATRRLSDRMQSLDGAQIEQVDLRAVVNNVHIAALPAARAKRIRLSTRVVDLAAEESETTAVGGTNGGAQPEGEHPPSIWVLGDPGRARRLVHVLVAAAIHLSRDDAALAIVLIARPAQGRVRLELDVNTTDGAIPTAAEADLGECEALAAALGGAAGTTTRDDRDDRDPDDLTPIRSTKTTMPATTTMTLLWVELPFADASCGCRSGTPPMRCARRAPASRTVAARITLTDDAPDEECGRRNVFGAGDEEAAGEDTPFSADADADADADVDGRLHVLVAEDNKVNQRLATVVLEKLGHVVSVAENGKRALDAVARRAMGEAAQYDLVLMDIQMPEMDGLEATRRIRALGLAPCDLPVVGLTANYSPADAATYRDAGMNCCLGKPCRLSALRDCLAKLQGEPGCGCGWRIESS